MELRGGCQRTKSEASGTGRDEWEKSRNLHLREADPAAASDSIGSI